jgi:uncharacterized LabA/DUF88 family protein
MDRFVIMVDAGYLLHKGVEIVSNKVSTERGDLQLTDPPGLIQLLVDQSKLAIWLFRKELLRVYWYDGVMSGGLTSQQRSICELPDVQFRSGLVNFRGQQKGVDSLIITDLFELASNHAVTDAILVTGDSDLAIGIELAQKKGVRIAVLGLEDLAVGVGSGQSREITNRADRVARFGSAELSTVMRYVPRLPAVPPGAPAAMAAAAAKAAPSAVSVATAAVAAVAAAAAAPLAPKPARTKPLNAAEKSGIDQAVAAYIAANPPPQNAVDKSTKRIDSAIDRALIYFIYTTLAHGVLDNMEKIYARESFRKQLGI